MTASDDQYLLWVSQNKKEARIGSDKQRCEFNLHFFEDTWMHAPKTRRMKNYWPRLLWHILLKLR